MSKSNLVIVESPAKAKTISKFLGKEYQVLASYGHVRDLPKSDMGIDIKNDFSPKYVVSKGNYTKKALDEIKKSYKKDETELYIATDEDREGEAIGWHIVEILKPKNKKTVKRIVFHEITEEAISNAIKNPREIDLNLVNAQQARRVLDRLVGYDLSPLLWRKIRPGLSAGRVQSVALRLICEKEQDIDNFASKAYFKIEATFTLKNGEKFQAVLNKKFENKADAKAFLIDCSSANFEINNVEKKAGKKSPQPPFTTSTLQQDAYKKLGFSVKKTMVIAQKLYETGKITYMRTDSVNLSEFALKNAYEVILDKYGKEYSIERKFKTKSKGAQEAHEAIRPTDFQTSSIAGESDEQRLYGLIHKRALASQMKEAILERTVVQIGVSNRKELFLTESEVIKFDGFLKVYTEAKDEEEEENYLTISLNKGDILKYEKISATEQFMKAPARYNEASLVKTLEDMGIGRPSTYAPTISTIQDRGYVVKESKSGVSKEIDVLILTHDKITENKESIVTGTEKNKLIPTPIGILVNDFLVKHFPTIVDYEFTANVEKEFDKIASGKKVWNEMISDFYKDFSSTITEKATTVTRKDATNTRSLGIDEKSGKEVSVKIGRFGPYVQIGTAEEEEKPKFAKLPSELNINTVTLEEVMELFKLPRSLGATQDGEEITVNSGRFGPYVKVGSLAVSIKKLDPMKISLEEALELIEEKKIVDKDKNILVFENSKIKVLNGKFGPYITDGKKNAKIPKDTEPKDLSLAECTKLLSAKKTFKKRNFRKKVA